MALHNLATLANLEFNRADTCLLVMPMCHANSLFFASAFASAGASSCVYDAKSFEPEHLLRTLAHERATFTSLVPTHYIMMLALPDAVRASYDVDSVSRLLISSAPARRDTKLAIMECFRNSRLLEMYGSTEQGWATLLRPDEQLTRLGSIGRELVGCRQHEAARRGRQRGDGRGGRRDLLAHALVLRRLLEAAREDLPRPSAVPTSRLATWRAGTRRASTISSTARTT